MFKRLALTTTLLVPALACTMWSKPASGWKGATGGEQIENLFWKDVQAKNWQEVDRHLAATFLAVGPEGTMNRDKFLSALQQAPLADLTLTDCQVQLNGADLMVACTLHARRNGAAPSASSTLSVWQQLKKGWVMVAHSESQLPAR